jgi:hypothetical protein
MEKQLPYVSLPNSMVRVLNKIRDAQTPDRFTQDFLKTKLGFKGGNEAQFIPFAKKLGLLNSDGTPSDLYRKFRNKPTSGPAIAQALKQGYHEVFQRNEYANNLGKDEFKGLVVEITGMESSDRIVQLICQTFDAMKQLADFEKPLQQEGIPTQPPANPPVKDNSDNQQDFDLNLSYTINLVLPKTDDPAVFNAIFRSLKENLLRK